MKKDAQSHPRIVVTKDGPYLVSGDLPLSEQWIVTNDEGDSLDYREGKKFPAQAQYARFVAAAILPANLSATARTPKSVSMARKPPAINPTSNRPKPLKARR
jgi:hypothetical protein